MLGVRGLQRKAALKGHVLRETSVGRLPVVTHRWLDPSFPSCPSVVSGALVHTFPRRPPVTNERNKREISKLTNICVFPIY